MHPGFQERYAARKLSFRRSLKLLEHDGTINIDGSPCGMPECKIYHWVEEQT